MVCGFLTLENENETHTYTHIRLFKTITINYKYINKIMYQNIFVITIKPYNLT